MSNNQAPAGGTIGQNGEFYSGGQFLPNTEMPKRPAAAVKKFSGPRKEQTARFIWEERPAGFRSIYAIVCGTFAEERAGRLFRFEPGIAHFGEMVVFHKIECGSVDSLITRYNAGDRWIAIPE